MTTKEIISNMTKEQKKTAMLYIKDIYGKSSGNYWYENFSAIVTNALRHAGVSIQDTLKSNVANGVCTKLERSTRIEL